MSRAPVYRHVESSSTIGGLTLPGFMAVLGVAFAAIALFEAGTSLLTILGAYVGLRLLNRGRPPQYWQHLIVFHVNRKLYGGRFSALARVSQPQFPFAPYEWRR